MGVFSPVTKGNTEKSFEDVPFDLLGGEEFESSKRAPKPRSETSEAVKYTRYRPEKRNNCDDCLKEVQEDRSHSVSLASYIRSDQSGSAYLCYLHTNMRRHKDQLDRLI